MDNTVKFTLRDLKNQFQKIEKTRQKLRKEENTKCVKNTDKIQGTKKQFNCI